MAVKTSVLVGGDVLIHRESAQKNMVSGTLKFPAAGGPHNLPQVAGYPAVYDATTKVFTLVQNNGTGNDTPDTNCLLIHGEPLSAVADGFATPKSSLYSAVNKGDGVVINKDAIPLVDTLATPGTLVQSEIITALEALNFKFVSEPVKKTTQIT